MCQWGYGEIGTVIHCCCEYKMVLPLWKKVWQFFKKLDIELPYDPAIPYLGIYLREVKTYIQTKTFAQMFTAALFKNWIQSNCPSTDEWIHKHGIFIQWNIIQPSKKEWSFSALAPSSEKPLCHESEVEEEENVQAKAQKKKDEAEVQVNLYTHGSHRSRNNRSHSQGRWYKLLDCMPTV